MQIDQLSESLVVSIREAIRQASYPQLYWDHLDELTPEQTNKLLVLPNGINELEREIFKIYDESVSQLEYDLAEEKVRQFLPQIADSLGYDVNYIDEADIDEIIRYYDLNCECPGIDPDIPGLVSNTRPRIVLQLELYHDHRGMAWREAVRYEEVEKVLAIFHINPARIHPDFPAIADRDGNEFILPSDLIELWDNASYGGQYVIPVKLSLSDFIQHHEQYYTGVILQKGGLVFLHQYGAGAGSLQAPLQKDLTLYRADVTYYFGDDQQTGGYGLDEVYGLTQHAWDNGISPVLTQDITPYTLPPVPEVLRYLMYGNLVADYQVSNYLRPFNDFRPKWNGMTPKAGEMLEFDLSHLWPSFPNCAKEYLRTRADKRVYHLAIRLQEHIGQVALTHCQFIVNDLTGEVVWQQIDDTERSREIFHYAKDRIKAIHNAQTTNITRQILPFTGSTEKP